MKFTLRIESGNASMQTREDLARALRRVAEGIDAGTPDESLAVLPDASGRILDDNGNTIGRWSIEGEE